MARKRPLPLEKSLKSLSGLFGVLAHPARIRILGLLRQREADVGTLQKQLGISQSRVSQHLGQLRHHGLVVERREGRHVVYRLASPNVPLVVSSALQVLAVDLAGEAEALSGLSELLALWGL